MKWPRRGMPILRWSWLAVAVAGISANVMLVSSLASVDMSLPAPPSIASADPLAQSTLVLDRNGETLAMLHGEEHRMIVSFEDIPPSLRNAVIAIEDAEFYEHGGVDLGAVARAVAANVTEQRVVQGASTITQQYVRNAFDEIGRERTVGRKLEETRAALQLEEELSKDQILARYLNTVYFGRGAYGIEAAARAWFSRPAIKLNLRQAATLAGVIHAPARYRSDEDALTARRNIVLNRMQAEGFINEEQATAAKEAPLWLKPSDPNRNVDAPYFVEFVRRQLKMPTELGGFGLTDEEILRGGLRVYTTLDLEMQQAAERAVRAVVNGKRDPEAAMVAMTTRGEIRAMVGGRKVHDLRRARGFNYATQRTPAGGRQAGSAFKPFTLAAYLDEDRSPRKTYRAPSRITIEDEICSTNGDPWRPANYQNQAFGSLSVIEATEKSVNTVYAQMISDVGPARVAAMAKSLGITSPLQPVCSLALGTMGVTPLEMARAYATLAARGNRPEIIAVARIVGPDGETLVQRRPEAQRVIDRRLADRVNAILEGVVQRGTGTPARIGRPAAGKTGTTEEHRDVWFAGYTPHPGLAAAVWMGYPPKEDGTVPVMTTLRGRVVTGGGFAGDIWRRFMRRALADEPEREFKDVSFSSSERTSSSSSSSSGSGDDDSNDRDTEEAEPPGREKRKKERREKKDDDDDDSSS